MLEKINTMDSGWYTHIHTHAFHMFLRQDDKRHGYGVYNWTNGDCYKGEWFEGRMHGEGCFEWANGDEYVGEWKCGRMHGHGKKVMANGD